MRSVGGRGGARRPGGFTRRLHLLWITVGFVAVMVAQAPGKVVADTKVDLVFGPLEFLKRATHLWNASENFGYIPNQYTGYLFPMGPFFVAGHALGVAPWLVQRLWMALLLTVACWGTVRLADRLGIGTTWTRIIGGLAYSLSPLFLGKIGAISVALTGPVMLPWMLLPLLRALQAPGGAAGDVVGTPGDAGRPGRPRGRFGRLAYRARVRLAVPTSQLSPRRAAALSGLAVLGTGGVNAAVTACVLVGPVVLLALAGGGRRAWALRAWWLVAMVLATVWWAAGLLALSRYGLNFLPYTETVETTTAPTSVPEALRGTVDWMAFLRLPKPWLPAATDFITSQIAIAGSAAAAALGLAGLARRDLPGRRLLLVIFGIGVVATAAGYAGTPGSPVAPAVRTLLEGPLSPFRNVYKFEPDIRLPVALGIAHVLTRRRRPAPVPEPEAPAPVPGDESWRPPRAHDSRTGRGLRLPGRRRAAAPGRARARRPVIVLTIVTVAALAAGSAPLADGSALPPGGFSKVPDYWVQAADWLAKNPDGGRTLVLPGTSFGEYDWGRPLDEPMQWLASSPWGERVLVPLGGVGSARWMDAIESELAVGDAPGLAAALARAGVGQVLVRNDLTAGAWDAPASTYEVARALMSSGLKLAASFGPMKDARPANNERALPAAERRFHEKVPALQVWTVPGGAKLVAAYPAATALVVSGGPEATVQLAGHALLPTDRAVILASDLKELRGSEETSPGTPITAPAIPPPSVKDVLTPTTALAVTDTFTRREVSYGLVHDANSYLLGPTATAAGETGEPNQWLDRPPSGHQTVAGYANGMSVTASSYGYKLRAAPDLAPSHAVDGENSTFWASRPDLPSKGAWLRLDVGHPVTVDHLDIRLVAETSTRPVATRITVTTAGGSVATEVSRTEDEQRLAVPPGSTDWFTVTFTDVDAESETAGAGIRELTVPGLAIQHYAQTPSDATALFTGSSEGPVSFTFDRFRDDVMLPFSSPEEINISRRFDVPRSTRFIVSGLATALPPPADAKVPADAPLTLGCGDGPAFVIDGTRYDLRVEGRTTDAATGRQLRVSACTPDGTVPLTAGQHVLTVDAGQYGPLVDSLTLVGVDAANASETESAVRTTTVGAWTAEHREITIGPGGRAFLAIRENASASWTATLNGVALTPVRLDGWQQGWIVPAGASGTVIVDNAPGTSYRRAIGIGLVLVLVLAGLALVPDAPAGGGRRRRLLGWLAAPARWLGAPVRRFDALAAKAARAVPGWWAATVLGTVAVLLVAGPVALAVPVLALLARLRAAVLPWVAGVAMTAAGVIVLVHPDTLPGSNLGAFSTGAQALGAVAFAAVVAALGVGAPLRRRAPGASPDTAGASEDASAGSEQ